MINIPVISLNHPVAKRKDVWIFQ